MTGAATDKPAELDEDAGTVSANFIGIKCVKV
ncbi:phage tail tube protein [Citrobacter freundii]|nr:phage tail tube protein [Citrobacter freundii]